MVWKSNIWKRTIALCMLIGLLVSGISVNAAAFKPNLKQVSENRALSVPGYLNAQGTAFDTYTKKDGYSFAVGSDGNTGCKVVHFTMNAESSISQKQVVFYKTKNIGHANDGTVYKKGKKKYLFVAISGGEEKNSKTYNGKKTKVGVIFLDEYKKSDAKIRGVNVKCQKGIKMSNPISKCAFSGITYVGKKKVDKKKKDVFVLKDGRTLYAAYVTISGKKVTLTIFDSARTEKPSIKYGGKKYQAVTQGVTYHNKYLYIPYSGESSPKVYCNMVIGRISYEKLFKAGYGKESKLQVYKTRIASYNGVALKKCVPESIFFRTLEGKDNLYLNTNRATTASVANDNDAVLRSKKKY